jgi:hypothetical protein
MVMTHPAVSFAFPHIIYLLLTNESALSDKLHSKPVGQRILSNENWKRSHDIAPLHRHRLLSAHCLADA